MMEGGGDGGGGGGEGGDLTCSGAAFPFVVGDRGDRIPCSGILAACGGQHLGLNPMIFCRILRT